MKKKIAVSVLCVVIITGCAGWEKPPTEFEQRIFNTTTGSVEQVTALEDGGFETNTIPVYSHALKPETVGDAKTAGGIANIVYPGSGGLVAGLSLGVLGTWARMRSRKTKSKKV